MKTLSIFADDESGATAIEYGLIAARPRKARESSRGLTTTTLRDYGAG